MLIWCQLRAREWSLALSGEQLSLFGILFTGGFKAFVEERVSGHPVPPTLTRVRKPPLKTVLGVEAEREAKGHGAGGQGAKADTARMPEMGLSCSISPWLCVTS